MPDAIRAGVRRAACGALELTEAQVRRLEAVFADGVCDWTVPGRGQVPLGEPWQTYGN